VLEDFDSKPTFSSFLPGVAGLYGKPVWCFYVNRGQAVSSFGFNSKDHPILEFNAANKAYQLTPFVGFRTFIKGHRKGEKFLAEPFSPKYTRNLEDVDNNLPKRIMFVGPNEVEIREIDTSNDLITSVKYIVLPEENFAALVRRTNITNSGSTPVTISVLDGLAQMEPVGGSLDWALKNMGRTLEGASSGLFFLYMNYEFYESCRYLGWMGVYQAGVSYMFTAISINKLCLSYQ
jgi:hypothetical protein